MVITIKLQYFLLILLILITQQINTFKLFDFFNFNAKETPKSIQNSSVIQIELLNETTTVSEITAETISNNDELTLTTSTITNNKSHNESTISNNFNYNNQERIRNTSEDTKFYLNEDGTNITDIDISNNHLNNNINVSENIYTNETITTNIFPKENEEQLLEITKNDLNFTSTITTIDINESSGQQLGKTEDT
ncbi:Hypothetical protein SRAE_X000175800 [Strongyloides ratti]|uniref:Uncharacterized protein n=1 Tax=Strongyloides ratti TaxID=34506 RepID=A0A090KXP0_STRRB|nr:Hypothetical protein SRAE_X000175800 [Strongyloides ratti]CEF60018.1 Hypothetical protein SRAE_X000175800 [Strongyloides ratti]